MTTTINVTISTDANVSARELLGYVQYVFNCDDIYIEDGLIDLLEDERITVTNRIDYALMGQTLRDARRAKKITVRNLAHKVGMLPGEYSELEYGKRILCPGSKTFLALMEALGLTADSLIFPPREE